MRRASASGRRRRSARTTEVPAWRRSLTAARLMPEPAPVTMATLPLRSYGLTHAGASFLGVEAIVWEGGGGGVSKL